MVLKTEETKRLGIFFVYDENGIIDDYIIVLLNALRKHMSKIFVVCNGILSATGREKLNQVSDEILVRSNTGFDGWAYKEGIEHIGWYELNKYDELIMFNHTIMGPVNSFDDMFEYMDRQDIDFWGITKHHKIDFNPFTANGYDYVPEHIQSHFLCVRKSMFMDRSFVEYWEKFPEINTYLDAIAKHEVIFTKKFADMGFKWKTYVETDDIEYMNAFPLMYMTLELVKNRKCPIFKRRMFFQDYADVLANTMGNTAKEFFDYLVEYEKYNVNLIWDNILRTCNQEDFVRCLNLRYILSSTCSDSGKLKAALQKRKIALVMHLYFEDLISDMCQYASYMPEETDIYVTTNTEEKKKIIEREFSERLYNKKLEVRVIENRGRDVSSALVGVKDIIFEYDYVCFMHDKKTDHLKPGTVGSGFAYKCFENIIYNRHFVNNVICLFEENPRLGILSPPAPNHADLFGGLGNEWGENYNTTKELLEKLNITVPLNRDKTVIAPYGSVYWFRPISFKKLYDFNWKYSDFPEEPLDNDGTISHAIERIRPLVVQAEGYYPALLMSDIYAGIECTNLDYYARTFNKKISAMFGSSYHHVQLDRLSQCKVDMDDKNRIISEYHKIKGEKYELELKALETMQYVEGLNKQIEELQMQTNLKYQIKKNLKRLFGKKD